MSEIDMLTRYYFAKEREENVVIEINDAYVEALEALETVEAENEKLRERVSELEELTDHRHYIPQEWYATLQVENAKLRELVRRYVEYTSQDRCEGCVVKPSCNDGEVDECWQLTEIRALAREMGIEVH